MKYISLILGIIVLIVASISWLIFPNWFSDPDRFWIQIGGLAIGVATILYYLTSSARNLKEFANRENVINSQNVTKPIERKQKAVNSENVDQEMKGKGGRMEQISKTSKGVKQRIE